EGVTMDNETTDVFMALIREACAMEIDGASRPDWQVHCEDRLAASSCRGDSEPAGRVPRASLRKPFLRVVCTRPEQAQATHAVPRAIEENGSCQAEKAPPAHS